jgi:hypothetical protein
MPCGIAVARLFRGEVFLSPPRTLLTWHPHVAYILPRVTKTPASEEAGYSNERGNRYRKRS